MLSLFSIWKKISVHFGVSFKLCKQIIMFAHSCVLNTSAGTMTLLSYYYYFPTPPRHRAYMIRIIILQICFAAAWLILFIFVKRLDFAKEAF